MQSSGRALAWVLVVVVIAMVGGAWGLSVMFGPTDNGMRCERTAASKTCRVFRTTFLGLRRNS